MTSRWDDREKAFDLNNDGVDLYEQAKFEESLACYNESISLNPKEGLAWFNKGMSLYELEKNKESVVCFDEAIKLNSQTDEAWFFKGNRPCLT